MPAPARAWLRAASALGGVGLAAAAVWGLSLAALERSYAATTTAVAVVQPSTPAPAATPTPLTEADRTPVPPTAQVSAKWIARTAARTGIPPRALLGYASAQLVLKAENPSCCVGWNTLAGIGWVESQHGSHSGTTLLADGNTDPVILGPLIGDGSYRATGPMQFIPSSWQSWGADGNGDGLADPNQIDDAALAAARYLCASGSLRTTQGWRAAVFAYNHSSDYVDKVADAANAYASRARG